MKLKKFKERDNKRIGIVVFTVACILLVSGVILYRTFAIFEVRTNQNVINGEVQSMGDIEFAFYQDDGDDKGDHIVKTAPEKNSGYSLDTSSSYCVDLLNDEQISTVNWDYENWEVRVKNVSTTKTKCYLHFKKVYQDQILNGADPDLMNGRLVPVKILDTDKPTDVDNYVGPGGGQVVKADITDESDPWYKYEEKKWANAVILRDGVVDNYKPGEEIKEGDIESYFVWIPRYKYKLKNTEEELKQYQSVTPKNTQTDINSFYSSIDGGNKGEKEAFDIQFETKDKGNTQNDKDYITHPAFISFDSNGLWVGKFETGYNQNTDNTSVMPTSTWSVGGAQQNTEASSKIIIKPNVYSWRNIQVANAFYTAYNYQRDLESHMMKNMEWGAVAYLTQSKYGRCEEKDGKMTCEEVRINNSEKYITGMSAANAPTCGYTATKESCNWYETTDLTMDGGSAQSYYNKDHNEASTTGNYSGIYDMAGGAWEYVMGVMQSSQTDATPTSGRSSTYNSGFNGKFSCPTCDGGSQSESLTNGKPWPSSKYYDLYDYDTTDEHYYRGKLGDGTKEFGPFYSVAFQKPSSGTGPTRYVGSYNGDDAFFVVSNYPWFERGGIFTDGTDAGLAAFIYDNGHANGRNSFRVVLAP